MTSLDELRAAQHDDLTLESDIAEAIWLQSVAPAVVALEQAARLTQAIAEQAVHMSPSELELVRRMHAA